MSYTIYNSDGTVLSTIAVGDTDNYSSSLTLVGKNVNNYGEYLNTNFIKLLTNSASTSTQSPISPLVGQLWYNRSTSRLTVYDGISFVPTYGSRVSGLSPNTSTIAIGDFWYDTINTQLNVWDGDSFNLVGPATSGLLGTFGIVPTSAVIRDNYTAVTQRVGSIFAHGVSAGIISTSSFNISSSDATLLLPVSSKAGIAGSIVKGVTLINDLEVLGRLFINGWDVQNHEEVSLTTTYDITPFGITTATTTEAQFGYTNSNYIAYAAANYAIVQDLAKLFDTTRYQAGSQVSVLCKYNTSTSVRKFQLRSQYPLPGAPPWWEPYIVYPYYWTGTTTSTVGQATWLWTSTEYTNITYPVWNELVRIDSTSSTSTTYLSSVIVGTTFYIKIINGIPNTGVSYAGIAPLQAFVGSVTLDQAGEFTTATIITNTIQPIITTATYYISFAFSATNHTRQLSITAIRP